MATALYIVLILCSGGLLALEIYTRDYSYNSYIIVAIVFISIKPMVGIVNALIWLLTPDKKPEPMKHHVERVLTDEEKRQLRLSKIHAVNDIKDLNASKNWEFSHNREVKGP